MTSQWVYLALLTLVALERLVELTISRRNVAWAKVRGGVEVGQGHFAAMKLLHGSFLLGCGVEVVFAPGVFSTPLFSAMLMLVLGAQALRYWTISTLGKRWNVQVIVLPGQPAVTAGPFRLLRHPNYLAVIVEGFALPLMHGAWITALSFSLLNAWLLVVRIRCEERALASECDYEAQLGAKRRFMPRLEP
ncbi:MAG: hypothetical protein JRH20_25175 [Deltaproteobacteria bacterium]|nr:hypothetical protein [Deltaproteobacteria bacterium]